MSNDISRVYQFLAKQGNWISAADTNGDGAIIKTEFRNFMEENFEWDGETSDAGKNDLINSFWNTIDTEQSGKISGTKLKNKNALDKDELETMGDKIEMYEILNEFTASITAPNVVSDTVNWKKSVSEGLGALIEPYIKNGGTPEELEAYLAEQAPAIEQKTTADYCANEYLKQEMGDFMKEYGYSYAEDGTLQNIIDTYIQNIPADVSFEEIKDTVVNIIDAYLSTAGLKEDNSFDLSEYGYSPADNSPLNDLQKSIIKKSLENALEEVKNLENYEDNKEIYDNAITEYINSVLTDSAFGDFEEIKNYGMTEFEASENYQIATNTIATKDLFDSEELKSAIEREIGSSFADRITGLLPGELESYDKILNDALAKVQNGEFTTASGELDTDKIIDWVIDQLQSSMADFYPNGLGDMPLNELNTTYDALVKSAKEQEDAAKVKEAAIMYCDALSDKSSALANAVKEIFGSDYKSAIEKLLTSEIDDKISELKAEAAKIGDISTFTIASFSTGIEGNNVVLETGASSSFNMSATVMNGTQTIDQSRISFSATFATGGISCSINSGTNTLTIQGAQAGTYTVEVQVLVDGVPVGETQTVSVTVKQSNTELVNKVTGWNGAVVEHLEALRKADKNNLGNQVTSENFADLYNSDANVVLHWAKDSRGNGWGDSGVQDKIRGRLELLGSAVVSALSTAGLDSTKLNTAVNTVIDRYINQGTKYYKKNKGDTPANCYNIMKDDRVSTQSYIVNVRDTNGKDSNIYAIHFKDFVDDILEEYWKLVG